MSDTPFIATEHWLADHERRIAALEQRDEPDDDNETLRQMIEAAEPPATVASEGVSSIRPNVYEVTTYHSLMLSDNVDDFSREQIEAWAKRVTDSSNASQADSRKEIFRLHGIIGGLQAECDRQKGRADTHAKALEASVNLCSEADKQIAELRVEVERLRTCVSEWGRRGIMHPAVDTELHRQLAAERTAREAAEKEVAAYREVMEDRAREIFRLDGELATLTRELAEAKAGAAAMRERYIAAMEQHGFRREFTESTLIPADAIADEILTKGIGIKADLELSQVVNEFLRDVLQQIVDSHELPIPERQKHVRGLAAHALEETKDGPAFGRDFLARLQAAERRVVEFAQLMSEQAARLQAAERERDHERAWRELLQENAAWFVNRIWADITHTERAESLRAAIAGPTAAGGKGGA